MNTFAHIKHIQTVGKVHYYSIVIDNAKTSLFEDFINFHKVDPKWIDDLVIMNFWLYKNIPSYGAQERFFRHEGIKSDTKGLPPKFVETKNLLRLYCFRANEHVVFLFNGRSKTRNVVKAQECPNVSPHFYLANKLVEKLNQLFTEKQITWNKDCSDIIVDTNFNFTID